MENGLIGLALAIGIFMNSGGTNRELQVIIHVTCEDGELVQLLVFDSPSGFPDRPENAIRSDSAPIKAGTAVFRFDALKEGYYALSAFHDADGDGQMRKSIFGIPKDAYGFSNDAREPFSAPTFKDASFYLPVTGTTIEFYLK